MELRSSYVPRIGVGWDVDKLLAQIPAETLSAKVLVVKQPRQIIWVAASGSNIFAEFRCGGVSAAEMDPCSEEQLVRPIGLRRSCSICNITSNCWQGNLLTVRDRSRSRSIGSRGRV
jgi:hypothetical protein